MGAPSPAVRAHATRIVADVADPTLDRGLGARARRSVAVGARDRRGGADARDAARRRRAAARCSQGNDADAKVIALDAIGAARATARRGCAALAADRDVRVRARVGHRDRAVEAERRARASRRSSCTTRTPACADRRWRAWRCYGDRGALADVTQALDDPSLGVRLAALGALVRLGRDAVGTQLLALGSGARRAIAYVALRAAVQLSRAGRGAGALPAVRAAADDHDAAVRAAAMNAAGELGRDGNALATAHLRDPDVDVRLAAARAVIATGPHDSRCRRS